MARRKVIADSEDEDEGDDGILPQPGHDDARPEPEPLSPQKPPGHEMRGSDKQPSDTDSSFFANLYDTHQNLAVQQSQLIENIVRQSQRASASSGDVSLPSKKKGSRPDQSSGTDVTSPRVLTRPRDQLAPFNDDASDLTTPRKSLGQVWDIPSSPPDEDVAGEHSTKFAASKSKPDSTSKRGRSRMASSPVAAETAAADETTPRQSREDVSVDHQLAADSTGSPMTPVAKRAKVSHHDSTLPDTAQFYIAPTGLTTMQKLEYQKVNVSANGYSGLPSSLPIQKSSGATTIPYSTPSGYSPIPPLPWEEPPAQPSSPQQNVAINISSSPDVIGNNSDMPHKRSPAAAVETVIPEPDRNQESPARSRLRTLANKGKKRSAQEFEEDELSRDVWDVEDNDTPKEMYKPRATKRRSVVAADVSEVENKTDDLDHISDEAVIITQDPTLELPATLEPPPPTPPPEVLPKKRGRKKKQPSAEKLNSEANVTAEFNETEDQNLDLPDKAAEAEPSPEKPKKKRGRPRKSDPPKEIEEPLPDTAPVADDDDANPPITESPEKDDDDLESSAETSRKTKLSHKATRKKKSKTVIEESEDEDKEELDEEDENDRLPLKEVDSNQPSPSKPASVMTDTKEETPVRSRSGSKEDEKNDASIATPTHKTQAKGKAPKPPTSASSSASKPTYRVGLSKRSRIAPLLKSIRK
ncbi:hypothetical protein F4808DRAFT_243889 [Astrocystis sublimbata]|nr:hypothetical protein F4808DRAFT_243889 [Astrocystis sublimbata]